ncbi:MAG: hypothetical protein OXF88_20875 [Rhodobacteraceae bacterium]|nr:hypothetical protein [Paracoccaceae bacterium]MCY4139872.1 hypothetical protein [Paracoccaceae bacterium]
MNEKFSQRRGYTGKARDITIRQDAPPELRKAIIRIARDAGISPTEIRNVVCRELYADPSEFNLLDSYILKEVDELFSHCEWFRVYDFAELFHAKLRQLPVGSVSTNIASSIKVPRGKAKEFETRLNGHFMDHGIGWQMCEGKIFHRGSDAFERATRQAVEALGNTGQQTAKGEIEEALQDISRRPEPDVTGAITHAMAALECVAREVTNKPNLTLGKLVPLLNLTPPLDKAVVALWGFSSERARHIREGQSVSTKEAELVVFVSCALCSFLLGSAK